jgi:hypothetical protein
MSGPTSLPSDALSPQFVPVTYSYRNLKIDDMTDRGFIRISNGDHAVYIDGDEGLALRNWLIGRFSGE